MTKSAAIPCIKNPGETEKSAMWDLAQRLFPIHRSILGPGITQVLDQIAREIPSLDVREFPTGTVGGDWTVPQEWTVDEAYIETLAGERIIDFADHPLHLWLYSRPFEGVVSRDDLLEKVVWSEQRPDAIPLLHSFYREDWGFGCTRAQYDSLTEASYRVVVRTRLYDGALRIGEAVLPGESEDEIVLDSYTCHPLLANDNQSGLVVSVELFKLLASLPRRRYTYRLILCPETIGPNILMHQDVALRERIVGGCHFVSCGDPAGFYYRRSFYGDSPFDCAMEHALRFAPGAVTVEDFAPLSGTTGNEKAYNAPGFFVPIGSFRRSQMGYPEHTTSADDLTFITPDALLETLQTAWMALQSLERNVVFRPNFTGEPFLTRYGIYPTVTSKDEYMPWDFLKGFVDGETPLIEIANKAGLPVTAFDEAVTAFLGAGLIEPV